MGRACSLIVGTAGLTTDVGWGCTLRSGQMLLAQVMFLQARRDLQIPLPLSWAGLASVMVADWGHRMASGFCIWPAKDWKDFQLHVTWPAVSAAKCAAAFRYCRSICMAGSGADLQVQCSMMQSLCSFLAGFGIALDLSIHFQSITSFMEVGLMGELCQPPLF